MTATGASGRRGGSVRDAVVIAGLLSCAAAAPWAEQAMTVRTTGGVLRVAAPGFDVLEGTVLERLRDGRSVRLDFNLAVLAQSAGPAIAETRQSFNLSFDLWEERFAVTRIGTPKRSVSHLNQKAAEMWCLDSLTIPIAELARLGSAPFWVRLAYRVPDPAAPTTPDDAFTLQRLIETLGRKPRDGRLGRSMEAGPFHLSR